MYRTHTRSHSTKFGNELKCKLLSNKNWVARQDPNSIVKVLKTDLTLEALPLESATELGVCISLGWLPAKQTDDLCSTDVSTGSKVLLVYYSKCLA